MENAVGTLAQHNCGLKCLSLCGTPAYSPGCSVMDLSRAVMQISALVFIPLGVTRSFTTGLITFCSLQVVEPLRLVVHKNLH